MKIAEFSRGAGGFRGSLVLAKAPEAAVEAWSRPGFLLLSVEHLYVHPLRRNLGWGGSLVEEALEWAKVHRADVWLYAWPFGSTRSSKGNPLRRLGLRGLENFYLSHGFRVVAREPDLEMLWQNATT